MADMLDAMLMLGEMDAVDMAWASSLAARRASWSALRVVAELAASSHWRLVIGCLCPRP
jgi:hypothetical protein